MNCGECPLARTNPKGDEDIYYCPFDHEYVFHSSTPCHHQEEFLNKQEPWMFEED